MDTPPPSSPAAAVVALKPSELAKSRLDLPTPLRQRLAETMALDTLRALAAALPRVLVVGGHPVMASRLARAGIRVEVVAEPARSGMNAALAYGAELLRRDGVVTVLACVGDLPALRPASVRRVLEVARSHPRAFLADASGVGTTMLAATGVPLEPAFSGRSAARHHRGGAVPLTEDLLGAPLADARRDVDTVVDLATAVGLGVGPATADLVEPATTRLGRYTVVTATDRTDDHGRPVAVTAGGRRVVLPDSALREGARAPRPGQRLHTVAAGDLVLSAWE